MAARDNAREGAESVIRVGFAGCGRIADLHRAAYENHPDAVLAAVCDTNAELAHARQAAWGCPKAYTRFEDLIADPDIDAVEIITPQGLHESMVIAAAEAGKHIAVQKPMTITLAAADRMLDAVRAAGVVFKVTDNYLTYPPIALAKRLIEDGVIGDPIMLHMKFLGGVWQGGWEVPESTWAWRKQEVEAGRGIQTFDHGHHMWTTAWFLMGDFERVTSWIDQTSEFIDCPAVIMWKHTATRRYGVCDYTQALELNIPTKYYACDEWFEITGNRGMILIRRCTGNVQDGPAVRVFTNEGWREYDVESDWGSSFAGAARNFSDAILGKAAPLLSGEQARAILRFAFALRRASDERREITMAEMKP